jgi:hypothetical protein
MLTGWSRAHVTSSCRPAPWTLPGCWMLDLAEAAAGLAWPFLARWMLVLLVGENRVCILDQSLVHPCAQGTRLLMFGCEKKKKDRSLLTSSTTGQTPLLLSRDGLIG